MIFPDFIDYIDPASLKFAEDLPAAGRSSAVRVQMCYNTSIRDIVSFLKMGYAGSMD